MKACFHRQGVQHAVLEPKEKEELLRLGKMLGHDVKESGGELKKTGRLRVASTAEGARSFTL